MCVCVCVCVVLFSLLWHNVKSLYIYFIIKINTVMIF